MPSVTQIDIPLSQQMNGKLPVFSLQLVLENAIKHNKLTQEGSSHYKDGLS